MRAELPRGWAAAGLLAAMVAVAAASPSASESPCTPVEDLAEIVFPSSIGDVLFPHEFHVTELGAECGECHHETDAQQLTMPHPEYLEDFWLDCTSCHRESDVPACPGVCSDCHHQSPTSIADESLSSKVVIHLSCWKCHGVGTGIDASRACSICHQPPMDRLETTGPKQEAVG